MVRVSVMGRTILAIVKAGRGCAVPQPPRALPPFCLGEGRSDGHLCGQGNDNNCWRLMRIAVASPKNQLLEKNIILVEAHFLLATQIEHMFLLIMILFQPGFSQILWGSCSYFGKRLGQPFVSHIVDSSP